MVFNDLVFTPRQKRFIKEVTEAVESNLGDNRFGVEQLARKIALSRSQLHRKLHEVMGISTSTFIRRMRLNYAIRLLEDERGTAAEIAYLVGFNSPTYFNTCFHKHYGYPPGEILKGKVPRDKVRDSADLFLNELVSTPHEKRWIDQFWKKDDLSIAVLPFKNLSPDQENQYFADGVTGDILNNLQRMHELRVISQTSVEQYRNTTKPATQIGFELSVSYLLEGSIRKTDDQLMITAQLIHAKYDKHIWARNFNSIYSTKGIFDIQREIAEKIASELQLKISAEKVAELIQPKTQNKSAYDHYLRGMFYWYQATPQSLETALRYFELARDKDLNYAPAYAGIAMVWGGYLQQGFVSYKEAFPKVKMAATKALALDSSLAEVHYMLAMVMQNGWWEWNWKVAEREFRKTLELNPNFAEARVAYSHLLDILGRSEEADLQARKAMEIEPFNPVVQILFAMHLNLVRKHQESIKVLNNLLATDPNNHFALSTLRSSFHNLQMYDEALEAWEKSFAAREDKEAIEALKRGNQDGGYPMALQRISELLIARSDTSFVSPWQIGTLYTRAGRNQEALDWLEKAYENHDPNVPYISADPIFDELRDDPRFGELLRKMKLPQKN